MIPSAGRIVHYRLDEHDVAAVHLRRRRSRHEITEPTGTVSWQEREGNSVTAGDVYPMMITRVWSDNPTESDCVQGQVFLDGNDTIWVTSRQQQGHTHDPSITKGVWFEPARV